MMEAKRTALDGEGRRSSSGADAQGVRGAAAPGRQRKMESRRRLMAAARRLFAERGYHATRPQDIARAAGLGHGTFYLYFEDKRDCFLAFVEEARQELAAATEARLAGLAGLEERIRATLETSWDYAERNPGVLGAALTDLSVIAAEAAPEATLMRHWGAHWAAEIRGGAGAGTIRDDYDAEIIGHAIIGLITNAATYGHRAGRERDALTENLTKFMLRALASDHRGERDAGPHG